jgi:protein ImuB
MLFGCIHVPDFPVQAALRAGSAPASFKNDCIAVLDGPESLLKIFSCNVPARQAGISIGMTKLQAEACPGVTLYRRIADQEDSAQADLLTCAYDFSPRVESTALGIVIFDLTGAGRLLGSQQAIGRQIAARAADFGFTANVALSAKADTALHAARGFAGVTVIEEGEEARCLACLPVEVLEPSPEILDTLESWGIRNFKALAALPCIPLTQRLGQPGLHLQRLAQGEVQRELIPAEPPPRFQENLELEETVDLLEPLGFFVNRLLDELVSRLRERSLAADRLQLDLGLEIHCDRQLHKNPSPLMTDSVARVPVNLHRRTLQLPVPTQDGKVLLKLLQLDLAAHPPPAPVKKVSLEVFPARVRTTQNGLFQPLAPEPAQLEITLARLRAAVGEKDELDRERVGFPRNADSHRPDSFQVLSRAEEGSKASARQKPQDRKEILECLPAPQLLLRRFRPPLAARVELCGSRIETNNDLPGAVSFHGAKAKVLCACGPWRGSGSWWDQSGRWQHEEWDVALSLNGASGLYRIFCDLDSGQWFVEGMYD